MLKAFFLIVSIVQVSHCCFQSCVTRFLSSTFPTMLTDMNAHTHTHTEMHTHPYKHESTHLHTCTRYTPRGVEELYQREWTGHSLNHSTSLFSVGGFELQHVSNFRRWSAVWANQSQHATVFRGQAEACIAARFVFIRWATVCVCFQRWAEAWTAVCFILIRWATVCVCFQRWDEAWTAACFVFIRWAAVWATVCVCFQRWAEAWTAVCFVFIRWAAVEPQCVSVFRGGLKPELQHVSFSSSELQPEPQCASVFREFHGEGSFYESSRSQGVWIDWHHPGTSPTAGSKGRRQ